MLWTTSFMYAIFHCGSLVYMCLEQMFSRNAFSELQLADMQLMGERTCPFHHCRYNDWQEPNYRVFLAAMQPICKQVCIASEIEDNLFYRYLQQKLRKTLPKGL